MKDRHELINNYVHRTQNTINQELRSPDDSSQFTQKQGLVLLETLLDIRYLLIKQLNFLDDERDYEKEQEESDEE